METIDKRLLVKFGTDSLTGENGELCQEYFNDIGRQVSILIDSSWQVVIVSSGAGLAGRIQARKIRGSVDGISDQSFTTCGQYVMMAMWQAAFTPFGHLVGQVLISQADLDYEKGSLNEMRNCLRVLPEEGFVAVANENDAISPFGVKQAREKKENDYLMYRISQQFVASRVLAVTSVGGVFEADPRHCPGARMYRELDCENLPVSVTDATSKSPNGTGGIANKATIAAKCSCQGQVTAISGWQNNAIIRFTRGESVGTLLGGQNRFWE